MNNYPILKDIHDRKPILKIAMIDAYTNKAVDIYRPFIDPNAFMDRKSIPLMKNSAIVRTLTPKDGKVTETTRKMVTMTATYSMVGEERHYPMNNLISVTVIDDVVVLEDLEKSLKEMYANLTEKNEDKVDK